MTSPHREILVNVERFPQPLPKRNPGGDCFACALTAVVRHLYPEKLIDFNVAWEAFLVESSDGTKVLSNSWATMGHTAPYALYEHGYRLEIYKDIVQREVDLERNSHAWFRSKPAQDFSKHLEAWLSAGWLAIVEMAIDGGGPYTPQGQANHTDHFVVLDGQRGFWEQDKNVPKAQSWKNETHVVCSAKGSYWIDTGDLMQQHGVAGLILFRRGLDTF